MNGYVICLKEHEAELVADQEVLRKAALDLIASYRNLQFELVCGSIEAAAKYIKDYFRAIGKCLVLAAYERIDWTYPTNRSRGKKNTRLQRVARQGAAAAAARLSILSDLRQKRAFSGGRSGRSHYTVGSGRRSLRSQKPAKPV
ncbi:hypothetical protein J2Y45_002135 [Dyadobacter sp. BE34]|uniref:Uncharacterized protein n=1 Tax=Dyadobacter fermentans TaxID=94254 RepID=A0ABU1QWL8_9BACT|nr:hypothetical protein [Dyadobacter fermentans]MDR7042684.1 hypothetical protein [Dyadobacter sp. BE242]MDR7196996.1 hypothetical protein [Dyadobacter sp. BE34]MDR7215569.1 hypothetical protein [Dyadobacter sp. BE31]MDR7263105.1 hypothetical protein [Dyadobacter sp. BE32]